MRLAFAFLLCTWAVLPALADENLAGQLKSLDTGVIVRGKVRVQPLMSMLSRDVDARLRQANRADAQLWDKVKTRADWERFRDARLQALRASLGPWPDVPRDLKIRTTGRHEGEGYRVDNIVFQSRPGLVVTANLYRPVKPAASMPAMLIVHTHARAKHNGTCQDMAMTWARRVASSWFLISWARGNAGNIPFARNSLSTTTLAMTLACSFILLEKAWWAGWPGT